MGFSGVVSSQDDTTVKVTSKHKSDVSWIYIYISQFVEFTLEQNIVNYLRWRKISVLRYFNTNEIPIIASIWNRKRVASVLRQISYESV